MNSPLILTIGDEPPHWLRIEKTPQVIEVVVFNALVFNELPLIEGGGFICLRQQGIRARNHIF